MTYGQLLLWLLAVVSAVTIIIGGNIVSWTLSCLIVIVIVLAVAKLQSTGFFGE